jgi:integrase
MKRAARFKTGSVVFDKRRKTWNYLWWEQGKRRSRLIGTLQQYPTKGSAWRTAQSLQPTAVTPIVETGMTVRAVAARYEAERFPTRHDTARTYRSWLRKHILPKWGDHLVSEIQPRPVELWLRSLPLSPKSKAHVRNMMYMLLDFAMWAGVIELARNPMELVVVKGATKRVRKPRNLTVNEFQKLLAQLHEPFRTIALLCQCFGLRISECLALKWGDVNWLDGALSIERSIVEQNVDDVKTSDSRKTLTIANELLDVLKAWRQATQFSAEGDWMFASPVKIGRLPYSYTGVWRELQRAAESAGIGKLGTHAFRHTYRTWLDSVGTPVGVQQRLMRHSDIRTTMNQYGDALTDDMRQAHTKVVGLALSRA